MRKIAGSLITLFLLLAVLSTPLFADGTVPPVRPEGAFSVVLKAGQHTDAGWVYVWNDDVNLYVQFVALYGWSLGETHLYVSLDKPTKAAPGRFPYKGQEFYTILLSDLGAGSGSELYIAAHAVVQKDGQQETAWGAGEAFAKNWAMWFPYRVGSVGGGE